MASVAHTHPAGRVYGHSCTTSRMVGVGAAGTTCAGMARRHPPRVGVRTASIGWGTAAHSRHIQRGVTEVPSPLMLPQQLLPPPRPLPAAALWRAHAHACGLAHAGLPGTAARPGVPVLPRVGQHGRLLFPPPRCCHPPVHAPASATPAATAAATTTPPPPPTTTTTTTTTTPLAQPPSPWKPPTLPVAPRPHPRVLVGTGLEVCTAMTRARCRQWLAQAPKHGVAVAAVAAVGGARQLPCACRQPRTTTGSSTSRSRSWQGQGQGQG